MCIRLQSAVVFFPSMRIQQVGFSVSAAYMMAGINTISSMMHSWLSFFHVCLGCGFILV